MRYLRVCNLDKYQHYKQRNPPWIKLHATMLESYSFGRLQDASKAHAIACMVLASRSDNRIPNDPEWIARRINATTKVDLDALVNAGILEFLDDEKSIKNNGASGPLAKCLQDASNMLATCYSQTETETETETEKISTTSVVLVEIPNFAPSTAPTPTGRDNIPVAQIVALYHETLPDLPRVEKLTKTRIGYIQQRWREDLPDLDHWRRFFSHVGRSDFLMGRAPGTKDRPPFRACLEWITKPSNFAKIAEEQFHGQVQQRH